MNIFIDTSSLFKLYHREADTELIESVFSKVRVTNIFLSDITKIEFTSTVWKKVRIQEISVVEAETTLGLFELDTYKYTFIATDNLIIEQARNLINKYGIKGLRTLDSIQLSSALTVASKVKLFLTSDILLKSLMKEEKLPTEISNL